MLRAGTTYHSKFLLTSLVAFLTSVFAIPAISQTVSSDPQVDDGIHSYGSYVGTLENVSLSSGNVSFCIPLVSLKGQLNHDLNIPFCYNSNFIENGPVGSPAPGPTVAYFPWVWGPNTPHLGPGWSMTGRPIYHSDGTSYSPTLFMADGSKYNFPSTCGSPTSYGCGPDGQMADLYMLSPTTVVLKDGTTVQQINTVNDTKVTDTNGFSITYHSSSVTDTMGRTVSVVANDANGAVPASISFQYPDPTATNATVAATVQVAAMTFTCQGQSEAYGATGSFAMPTAVTLANGSTYTFQYDKCGLLAQITYPTGGYTRFDYTGQYFATGVPNTSVPANEISHKYVCPAPVGPGTSCSVSEQVTTYTPVIGTNNRNNSQMTVKDPVGNTTVYQFSQGSPAAFSGIQGVETSRTTSDASGKVLRSVATQYINTVSSACSSGSYNPMSLPAIQTTTLDNGLVSQVQWDYSCYFPASNDTVLTEKREYDFGTGAPGPLLRNTDYTWLHRINPSAYGWRAYSNGVPNAAAHILDRKTSEVVFDGSGHTVAQTKYVYDNNNAPSTGSVLIGVLTSVSHWRNTDGKWLTTTYNGGPISPSSVVDPNGNITSFDYTDNYADGVNRNTHAYPTTITHPATNGLQHIEHRSYYYGGGLLAATCGENFTGSCLPGVTSTAADYTSYTYDSLGRSVSTRNGDGGSSSICYSDNAGSNCYTGSYPLTVTSAKSISAGVTATSRVLLDGLGRVTQSQLTSDPYCNTGTLVDTTYDVDGRISTTSNPYCSTADPTYGLTTYAYDGLSRVLQIQHPDRSVAKNTFVGRATQTIDEGNGAMKNSSPVTIQRIVQSDALGRMASVCEVSGTTQKGTSNATPANCGLDISGTGFLTTYGHDLLNNLTSVTQGGVGRSFVYDSLSRLQSATNPESGKTTYLYDLDGNLTSKTDARTITSTYTYDALNRLTGKTYSDGTTPSACFQYDQTNSGRLATEWTQAGVCPSSVPGSGVITKRTIASYDALGRVLIDQQCATPGSCSAGLPFGVSYNYDLAGDVISSTNGLAGASAMTFQSVYDSAGRLDGVAGPQSTTSGSPLINLFSTVSYTPAGAMQNAVLGPDVIMHRDYDNRLRPIDEIDKTATGPGTATLQLSGAEQLSSYSTATITFSGSEKSTTSGGQTTYDYGNFVIVVGSNTFQVQYGPTDTASTLATKVASQCSCSNGPVQANTSGGTVFLASCQAGTNTSYTLNPYSDGSVFTPASFTVAASGTTMTKQPNGATPPAVASPTINEIISSTSPGTIAFFGTEQQSGTTYDSGAFYFQVANSPQTGPPLANITIYYDQGSTPASLATALAAAFASCSTSGTKLTASASGSTVTVRACQSGASYSIYGTLNGHSFTQLSFSLGAPPTSGGFTVPAGVYDSGTVKLMVDGTQIASASYSSSSSTAANLASALAAANTQTGNISLTASGTSLTITALGAYADSTAYSLTISHNFPQASFAATPASGTLSAGQNTALYSWSIGSYAPNGDILSLTDSVMGNWQYAYDDLNRLTSATASSGYTSGLALNWDYDRYGNRWDQNATGTGSAVQTHFTFTGNNNRIDSRSYDPDGNLLNDGNHAYTYDAENRIATVDGQKVYIYDATGARVAKLGSGGALAAVYILGSGGQQITELNGSGQWQHSNVYAAGGRLIATYTPATNTYHYNLTDWLGTKRMQTNASGHSEETCTSYPFGDGLTCTGSTDATEQHLTGKGSG